MFTHETLSEYIGKGLISVQSHPNSDKVCIYNYTPKCQYEGAWDEVTTKCRGLIIDWRGERPVQLSNPLPKFFNYEEHIQKGREVPTDIPAVFEKYDGWLGILYWLDGEPWIATRGSFASTGAVWATEWFRKYVDYTDFNDGWTHLFEIISPITKIVVHYPFEGLVWLTARHIEKGIDAVVHSAPFSLPTLKETPEKYGGSKGDMIRRAALVPHYDYEGLKVLEKKNEEGFVMVYPSGLRLKIKFNEYKRLHKIITGLSEIGIWEMMKDGKPIEFEDVPDEFFTWVNDVQARIRGQFHELFSRSMDVANEAKGLETRKDQAQFIMKNHKDISGVVFSILDGEMQKAVQQIYKMIRPNGSKVFKKDDL